MRTEPIGGPGIGAEDARERGRDLRAALVRRALDRLPPEELEVLALAFFGRRTQAEIAERLGLPLATVKARMFGGLRQLAEELRAAPPDDHPRPPA